MENISSKVGGWQSIKNWIGKSAKRLNALSNLQITRSGLSDTVTLTENGILINVKEFPKPRGAAGDITYNTIHAFQLVQNEAANELYVRKGTVDSIIPTISAVALADDYTDNELTFTGTGTTTFYLKAISTGTLDNEGVTSVSIETTSPGADTNAQAKQFLGSVTASAGVITAFSSGLTGGQSLLSCGSTHDWSVI